MFLPVLKNNFFLEYVPEFGLTKWMSFMDIVKNFQALLCQLKSV